jgi:hypothetical protein
MTVIKAHFVYPEAALLDRVIPKIKLYEQTTVSGKLKEAIVSQLEKLVWRYSLSEKTLKLDASQGLKEIQVFDLYLKSATLDDAILTHLDKSIPFPIVFRLYQGDKMQIRLSYKRQNEGDASKWVVEKHFATDWFSQQSPAKPLPVVLSIYALYEAFVREFLAERNQPEQQDLKSDIERVAKVESLEHKIIQLKRQIANERQSKKQLELNAQLRVLSKELTVLTSHP